MKHWTVYFSYWIYFYFIAYFFKIIKYNPILLIILSCLNNFQNLFKQIIKIPENNVFIILLYLNLSIHFIPFIYLYKEIQKSNKTKSKKNDYNKIIIFNLILFILYLLYVNSCNLIMYNIYNIYNYDGLTLDNFINTRFNNNIEFMLFIILTLVVNYYIYKYIIR